MYPENDNEFKDDTVVSVDGDSEHGWFISKKDSWAVGVPKESPVVPAVGMSVRLYGEGIGYPVRGMFIDGQKVYYRTEAEDKEHGEISLYGADAREWLKRWDEGRSVWTIEMGGLGPGYEQCIHIVCAEVLRYWFTDPSPIEADFSEPELWKALRKRTEEFGFENPIIDKLGLSGAQWGAGMSIAAHLYRKGPRAIANDPEVKDRKIQVSKNFPQAA